MSSTMFWLTLIVMMFVVTVSGKPETHRLVKVQDGVDIPQDIVYDEEANTVLITVAPVPELGKFIPTINFHDYNTSYVAFKDVSSLRCYVSFPPIPFPTPGVYKMKRTNLALVTTAVVGERVMSPEEVGEMAGERIRDFCSDYATYWMDLKEGLPRRVKRSALPRSVAAQAWLGCGICIVCN